MWEQMSSLLAPDNTELRNFVWGLPLIGIVLWVETRAPFVKGRGGRFLHVARSLGMRLLNILLVNAIFYYVSVSIEEKLERSGFGLFGSLNLPLWADVALGILLLDLWLYWVHRISHKLKFVWKFHRMHHADTDVDASTAFRFHPLEVILFLPVNMAFTLSIGVSPYGMMTYMLLLQAVQLFHHSNIRISERWDRALRILIVTPVVHRVHHSPYGDETDSNFSLLFSFWDRLFGTYQLKKHGDKTEYGLVEFGEKKWETFVGMLKIPFARRSETLHITDPMKLADKTQSLVQL